jgi:plasmid replication initiation protein
MINSAASAQSGQLSLPLSSPLVGKFKNERNLMTFNFFSLVRRTLKELPIYDDGKVRIEVAANKYGVANIWDKELLIYLASLIRDGENFEGRLIGRQIAFCPRDFFKKTGTTPNGAAYKRLQGMLRRLKGTTIYTNIQTGNGEDMRGAEKGVSWIDDYELNWIFGVNGEKLPRAVTVTLSEWLYNALAKHKAILTYHPDYFQLDPLERRLYEIARAHCGQQNSWAVPIEKLRRKVGSDGELTKFKENLVRLQRRCGKGVDANGKPYKKKWELPEYSFMIVDRLKLGPRDPRMPLPTRRTPVKQYVVIFYRQDYASKVRFDSFDRDGLDDDLDDL